MAKKIEQDLEDQKAELMKQLKQLEEKELEGEEKNSEENREEWKKKLLEDGEFRVDLLTINSEILREIRNMNYNLVEIGKVLDK